MRPPPDDDGRASVLGRLLGGAPAPVGDEDGGLVANPTSTLAHSTTTNGAEPPPELSQPAPHAGEEDETKDEALEQDASLGEAVAALSLGDLEPPFEEGDSSELLGGGGSLRGAAQLGGGLRTPPPPSGGSSPNLGAATTPLAAMRGQPPFVPAAEKFALPPSAAAPAPPSEPPQQRFGSSGFTAGASAFQPGTGVVPAVPSVPAAPTQPPSAPEARALSMAELMPASQEAPATVVPSEIVLDCVHMVFNNVSHSNLDTKVKDIAPLLKAEHFPWFANYLVVKRISTQPNFHAL